MGAWGPAIFSDDVAVDIRAEYRALLEDQVPDDEATSRVVQAWARLDEDEEHILWLALAATQSQLGRLDGEVEARALDVIDNDRGLELWEEAGPKELAKRRAVLAKLRGKLTGPQPARRAMRRPWRHETDLVPGDILSFTASNGVITLLRVLDVHDERIGAAPIVQRLAWSGPTLPPAEQFGGLGGGVRDEDMLGRRPATYYVARFRKKDADWRDSGFAVVAHVPPRPEDSGTAPASYLDWRGLRYQLERGSASPPGVA